VGRLHHGSNEEIIVTISYSRRTMGRWDQAEPKPTGARLNTPRGLEVSRIALPPAAGNVLRIAIRACGPGSLFEAPFKALRFASACDEREAKPTLPHGSGICKDIQFQTRPIASGCR